MAGHYFAHRQVGQLLVSLEQAAQMPAMWLDQEHASAQPDHQERRTMPHISSIPEILADIKAANPHNDKKLRFQAA